jgi:light-regulated signal transduction histidine kinase (bacteriophytochrome)
MRYILTSLDGLTIFNGLTALDEKIVADACAESIISENRKYRYGKLTSELGRIIAISDNEDFIRSSQKFKNTARCILNSLQYINQIASEQRDKNNRNTARLVHNLTTLNAHNIQEVYSLVPQEEISGRMRGHVEYVKAKIMGAPDEAAKTILRIAKNNASMKAEFSVFKKLFVDQPDLRPAYHVVHKVLMNILSLFFPDFTDKEVYVELSPSELRAYFDYESMHVALYHLIDNAAKYTRPSSRLYIEISSDSSAISISFKMRSVKILPSEYSRIYEEGFSGSLPERIGKSGGGIGMGLIKKIVESNNGGIQHRIFSETVETVIGIDYQDNEFVFSLPARK